jgi:hypothetical protein
MNVREGSASERATAPPNKRATAAPGEPATTRGHARCGSPHPWPGGPVQSCHCRPRTPPQAATSRAGLEALTGYCSRWPEQVAGRRRAAALACRRIERIGAGRDVSRGSRLRRWPSSSVEADVSAQRPVLLQRRPPGPWTGSPSTPGYPSRLLQAVKSPPGLPIPPPDRSSGGTRSASRGEETGRTQ